MVFFILLAVGLLVFSGYQVFAGYRSRQLGKRTDSAAPPAASVEVPSIPRAAVDSISAPYLPRPVMDAPIHSNDIRIAQLTSALEAELGRAMQKSAPSTSEPPNRPRLGTGTIKPHTPDIRPMVFIPGGEFWMGSDDKDDNERPMHKILVEDFYIDPYPVTNREFMRFVDETGYVTEAEELEGWIWVNEWKEIEGANWRCPTGPSSNLGEQMDHPVVLVSWNDAQAFCQWSGKRLPSEAEWEKAARGTDGRRWPWGNDWDKVKLNSGEAGPGGTTTVRQYVDGASVFGCFDMAGNVWEWVNDSYKAYPGNSLKDEDFGEKYRVFRGGSWDSFGHNARCANRTRNLPRACVNVNGFRCALSAPDAESPLSPTTVHEKLVSTRRLIVNANPLTSGARFERAQQLFSSNPTDKVGDPRSILEMGRQDIEAMLARQPFLFRTGKKAHNLQQLADVCKKDPDSGRHHLRSGDFTAYLKLLGWKDPHTPERIARAFPGRDLPYFLALCLSYSRELRLGQPFLPPSEEVLEQLTLQYGLANFTLRRADVIVHGKDNSEMVIIPGGEFIMGSSEAQLDEALLLAGDRHPGAAVKSWFMDESPLHTVHLETFAIDKYPVTNAQFAAFVKQTGYEAQGDWKSQFIPGKENHPVVLVTWYDATAYAKWAGKRLPTEAEWEKAARGTDGRKYPWGNKWDPSRLNCQESGHKTTTPIGQFANGASPYGVMDMLGNVWEWTDDWYNAYPNSDFGSDKFGTRYKVFRGGSWNNYHFNNRCANRHREIAHCYRSSHGFRCARSVSPQDVRPK